MAIVQVEEANFSHKPAFMGLATWLIKSILITVTVVAILFVWGWNSSVSAQEGTIHIVQSSETLSTIARRYGVSLDALARHNGIVNVNLLRVGQSVRIPATVSSSPRSSPPAHTQPAANNPAPVATRSYSDDTGAPTSSTTASSTRLTVYTVRSNDSLFAIARRFRVSVEALKQRNGIQGDFIWVGQRLIIP
jgi:LysM repeat protein